MLKVNMMILLINSDKEDNDNLCDTQPTSGNLKQKPKAQR